MKSKSYLIQVLTCCSLMIEAQESAPASNALPAPVSDKSFEIYGFAMLDLGYNANQIDPAWYDVVRPTKLPSYKDQYGPDGTFYMSVRQTQLGVKSWNTTALGELRTILEFEMFGTGADEGQTTLRLRHAYGEIGKWGAGQYWSPFMDIDAFPNIVEYWGPPGMPYFRNVQVRYMPLQGESRLTFALERPGASADQGNYTQYLNNFDMRPHFPYPDLSMEYRYGAGFGYVELAGIVRYMGWDDIDYNPVTDLDGNTIGWGGNLSTNLKLGSSTTFKGSFVYGQGIENYMNDATVDIGVKATGDVNRPVQGVALPVMGTSAFIDHRWSGKFSTSLGYSFIDIENAEGSADNQFRRGDYIVVNLLCTPAPVFMLGIEGQYGTRENFKDNYKAEIMKIQFSFKYNFSYAVKT